MFYTKTRLMLIFTTSKHMDKHERNYRCLQQDCSKLEGFTSRHDLVRHEKEILQMHGGPELFYCPYSSCDRAENSGRPFSRKSNLEDHIRHRHRKSTNAANATSIRTERQILPKPNEVESPTENSQLRARIDQLERRLEQLEDKGNEVRSF
jgi:hypothetical protein